MYHSSGIGSMLCAFQLRFVSGVDGREGCAGNKLRRKDDNDNGKSSNGSGQSSSKGQQENGAMGIQKGDGVYYINSPEFTGGLGKREVAGLIPETKD